ncbi:thymidine phosphorylase family protein [Lacimicrobium alkaliphilum]|uniref:Putative thymidine phosphorylase n=1 Tax=Lacimicrobium alkaliphilum TaxID=1526571 RepID=A0A0U2JJI3_9ALTE|nr:thymidine phosphorylase family protein [Lacimicrobium alkaliphilum]ALS99622.1 thymidine phosphorylase [Lacimicrobium alkaliphilum]
MKKRNTLKATDMGINTHHEPVIYMREDCEICQSEGFSANSRLLLECDGQSIIATLNIVDNPVLAKGYAGLSKIAMQRLMVKKGDILDISQAPVVSSLAAVRKKIFGNRLSPQDLQAIIMDIGNHRYSDIEIASFLSVCAGSRLNMDEITGLTLAMVNSGKRLLWPDHKEVFDKHCIGGLPGNRTTPIVVSVVSAGGLIIPKTSSRAITSPAGTADTMETLANVNLSLSDMRRVVAETGACLAWGGAVNLSPTDDLLIRIERALDLDGEGQLIASVLSKKIAAGSTHVVIDVPVGETAKVRTHTDAERLISLFTRIGQACGLTVRCVLTDGSQPIGRGIGPALEATDVLAVLQNETDAPQDLRNRALLLSAHLFDLAQQCGLEQGLRKATELLDNGNAWQQFQRIINTQGELKKPVAAKYRQTEKAPRNGMINAIDNRQLARLAKLAGAPSSPAAGLYLHTRVGQLVTTDSPLFTLHSNSRGELDYAMAYYQQADIFSIKETQ